MTTCDVFESNISFRTLSRINTQPVQQSSSSSIVQLYIKKVTVYIFLNCCLSFVSFVELQTIARQADKETIEPQYSIGKIRVS